MSCRGTLPRVGADQLDQLWRAFSRGEAAAREQLLALYYDEFRAIARRVLNGDHGRMHIQPTDLVHEAAIRMIHSDCLAAGDQSHFLALAARGSHSAPGRGQH